MEIEEIIELVRRGLIDEALQHLEELEDIDKVIVLSEAAVVTMNPDFIDEAIYILEKHVKRSEDKVIGYSEIALALAKIGYYEEATEYFNRAISLLNKLDKYDAAISAMFLGTRLARAGFYDSAFDAFEDSFDMIIDLDIDVSKKTDLILSLADIIEKTGDELTSDIALKFYERAYDIFDKLKVGHRAGMLEKKIRLSKVLSFTKDPEIRKLTYEGRFRQAVYKVHEKFEREKRGLAVLEIALWANENNMPEGTELLEIALKEIEPLKLSDEEVKRAVEVLVKLEKFQKAIEFAESIRNGKVRDEALAIIGERFIELGEVGELRELIIPKIKSEEVKKELLSKL
ncbi:hypothetical protein P8X24_09860 [Pyrococcus kukulkanii]|uniref:hypothetical protein n=1 Tax=Pyrococcus kukulkanii TaxID=1609559 RepID=UPI003568897D